MIEKTIFIVKPVYIPIEVPVPASSKSTTFDPALGKKLLKRRGKAQKAIYMERQTAPNYSHKSCDVKASKKASTTTKK